MVAIGFLAQGNTPPYNTSTLPDVTFQAGVQFVFDFDKRFFEDDQDNWNKLEYTVSTVPSSSSWLNFVSSARKFSGTPPIGTSERNYTVTVT